MYFLISGQFIKWVHPQREAIEKYANENKNWKVASTRPCRTFHSHLVNWTFQPFIIWCSALLCFAFAINLSALPQPRRRLPWREANLLLWEILCKGSMWKCGLGQMWVDGCVPTTMVSQGVCLSVCQSVQQIATLAHAANEQCEQFQCNFDALLCLLLLLLWVVGICRCVRVCAFRVCVCVRECVWLWLFSSACQFACHLLTLFTFLPYFNVVFINAPLYLLHICGTLFVVVLAIARILLLSLLLLLLLCCCRCCTRKSLNAQLTWYDTQSTHSQTHTHTQRKHGTHRVQVQMATTNPFCQPWIKKHATQIVFLSMINIQYKIHLFDFGM